MSTTAPAIAAACPARDIFRARDSWSGEALFDFAGSNGLRLKDRAMLRQLLAERSHAGDTVVTYCWVGYRASATWFAARMLGYETKFYDGSYQDWRLRKLPTTAGAQP